MVSNEESLCLYSTLTTFFSFDIFIKFFIEEINEEDEDIYWIEGWGRRRMRNGVLEVGGWRWQIQMINI